MFEVTKSSTFFHFRYVERDGVSNEVQQVAGHINYFTTVWRLPGVQVRYDYDVFHVVGSIFV